MISSAVLIPEEPQQNPAAEQSPTLKRRQSSLSESSESSKRPRLDTQPPSQNGHVSPSPSANHPPTGPRNSNGNSNGQMSPPAPRRRPTGDPEQDKSRNKRLFGALLGNLSQPSKPPRRSPAGVKSQISTAPLLSTLRRDDTRDRTLHTSSQPPSQSDSARAKRESLARDRHAEQLRWDEEAMRRRHVNMRATAGFLMTKALPMLYYKPWEMKAEENEIVERQKEDIERVIEREVGEFADKRRKVNGEEGEGKNDEDVRKKAEGPKNTSPGPNGNGAMEVDGQDQQGDSTEEAKNAAANGDVQEETHNVSGTKERTNSQEPDPDAMAEAVKEDAAQPPIEVEATADAESKDERPASSGNKSDEHDHGGEELERGQEDDVIY